MEDFHVVLDSSQHIASQDIYVFHPFVFHEVGEALFLHTGHIDDVGILDDFFVESRMLLIADGVLVAIEFIFLWHG